MSRKLEAELAVAASAFERFPLPNTSIDISVLLQPASALKHYTHQKPRDAASAHLYALICERLDMADEAVSALERAVSILEEEFEATESSEIEQRYSMALCDLGRVRLAGGQYQGSLEAFTNCLELVPQMAILRIQCKLGQGLAHVWLEQIDESLKAFQASLDEAAQSNIEGMREEVTVLLSRTLWGLGGEDAKEAAKTHLLEW